MENNLIVATHTTYKNEITPPQLRFSTKTPLNCSSLSPLNDPFFQMATMAFPAYDGFARSMSRRPSMAYPATPRGFTFPEQHPSMYHEPMMAQTVAGDYPQPAYQIYAPSAGNVPISHRLTGPTYDDLDIDEPYYDNPQLGMTPLMTHGSMVQPRRRRHSTVSFAPHPPPIDTYRRPGSMHLKFKRKGSFTAGISLAEAQSHVRLSGNDAYTLYDLHADPRKRILLRVRWAGYQSLTYEIPLDSYDGRISLSTLARRVSRACVHYLQANVIPVPWDRVELHHLEEISYGMWQPMLSSH